MKRMTTVLLLVCILFAASCSVLSEAAFTVEPNPPKGVDYSYAF